MKKTKLLSFLLAAFLLAGLFSFSASAASSSVTATYNAYHIGDNIRVNVTLNAGTDIGSWDLTLSYNANLVTYLSGANSGGGGVVRFVDSNNAAGQTSKTFSALFSAKAQGTCTFALSVNKLVNFNDFSSISCPGSSCSVKIDPKPEASAVNTLSALMISPGDLTPAFHANTLEYTVTLPYENTSLTVSATPSDGKARVAVGDTALKVGENVIAVRVTAENGAVRTYTLRVTRQASEFAGVTAELDGREWSFAFDPALVTAPAGFAASSSEYQGKKVLAYKSAGEKPVVAVALIDGEETKWFLYDEETGSFSPFVSVPAPQADYVILPLPKDLEAPAGYEAKETEIGGQKVTLFSPVEEKDGEEPPETGEEPETALPLVAYALDEAGNAGLYYLDAEKLNFFPYFAASPEGPKEDPPVPVVPDETGEIDRASLENAYQSAKENADRWEIIAMALGFVAVLLIVVLVLVLVKKNRDQGNDDDRFNGSSGSGKRAARRDIRKKEQAEKDAMDDLLFGK